jgi:KDO2-lipid IV(A) lauroyltransferase
MLKHCFHSNSAQMLFDRLAEEGKSIIIVMGHKGNWEWAGNTFSILCKHQLYVIYHPLENKYFNRLVYNMRCRFGTKLIAMRDTYKDMLANKNELNATAFIADQAANPQGAHWMTFLNQDTPVFKGTEKIAQKIKYPVVYVSLKKVKRGYYEVYAEELRWSADRGENEITELHTRKLEQDIMEEPETWLWSHRRWKHKRS